MNRRQATHLAFKASRHFLAPCGRVKFDVLGILALVFASATTATGDDDICGPDALRLLTSTDYEHNIWKSLEQLRSIEQQCVESTYSDWYGGWYGIYRAQVESFVGNHRLALKYADRRGTPRNAPAASPPTLPPNAHSAAALPYIIDRAKQRQIVIVNERHHVSTDRLLTISLLAPLAELGYRYLAIEAVWNGDPVNERGYAVGATGYYVNDTVFAEMIREAVATGYTIVPYEIEGHQGSEGGEAGSIRRNREYWQATNLRERTLKLDANAKVLIHCGYSHLLESEDAGWMASILKSATGIDPLTVDQTLLSERSASEFEHPWRVEADKRALLRDAHVILTDPEGRPLAISSDVDLRVVSPSSKYREGRPTWMDMGRRRRAVSVDVPECVDQICIVEVGDGRKPDSVPYDRIEVDRQSTVVVYAPHIRASASTDESLATVRIFGLDGELLGQRNLD